LRPFEAKAAAQEWGSGLLEALLRSTIRYGRVVVSGASEQPIIVCGGGLGPDVAVRLSGPLIALRLALNPDLALGEAYMDGDLVIEQGSLDDLFELIGLNLANRPEPAGMAKLLTRQLARRAALQGRHAAERNVAHHYDLSEDLYRLFLDPEMQYSCAYFRDAETDLTAAQQAKINHILAKLDLQPNQRVLDIGCGWGGLALQIARTFDVRVTGITLSRQQLEAARKRAVACGLSDRVQFELTDYREVRGDFERIVSVGMFEHVGPRHYEAFFQSVRDRLTPDGVALIHSIGARVDDGGTNPWIRKYIFPGGFIPTLSETLSAIERNRLWVCDIEVLRLHYARTLRQWLARFREQRHVARALYDERFCRMWEFYLTSCAMAFRHGNLMVMQLQLAKQIDALPATRDYIGEIEKELARR
jgi:cyclopropane-fatty-acyl-phospholipid synthase